MTTDASPTAAQPFEIERAPGATTIGIIRLSQADSPVVVLDYPLIQRIEATLRLAARQPLTGLILASASARVFVAGADLKTIQDPRDGPNGWNDDQLNRYLANGQRVFGALADLPFPTAAAIHGAALGGGLELAMHCDGLVGCPNASGKPYPIGLPEAGLSICPGWGGTNLLPARLSPADAIARTTTGRTMMYDDAVNAGLFDATAGSEAELTSTCVRWLTAAGGRGIGTRRQGTGTPSRWIGSPDRRASVAAALATIQEAEPSAEDPARAVHACIRAGLEAGWSAALDAERTNLVRLRGTVAGRAAIKAFFEKKK